MFACMLDMCIKLLLDLTWFDLPVVCCQYLVGMH